MNERFYLNSAAILAWLHDGGRKKSYLARVLKVSESTVRRMLNESHIPEERRVTEALAALMGVQESQLLLPREPAKETA